MKRACDLCIRTARIHCESDKASLCWDCDARVHSANFLVARHSRNLLCRVCQSPTPWSAAGSKLEPTFSHCRTCVNRRGCDGREGVEEEEAVEEEQEVVESQIVPCSPAPPASESSLSGGEVVATRKRGRLGNDRLILDDLNICPPPSDTEADVVCGADSTFRGIAIPRRKIGRTDACEVEVKVSKSPVVESVRRYDCDETISGDEMTEYIGGGRSAVDLNLSLSLFNR